jgi:hypothetical protein
MDNPIPPANKVALIENLLRVISAPFGDWPHSLNHPLKLFPPNNNHLGVSARY